MPVARNTFIGGMDQDTSVHSVESNKYFDAMNMRLVTKDPMSIGSIENEKGNSLSFSFPDSADQIYIFDMTTDGSWAGTFGFNGNTSSITVSNYLTKEFFDDVVTAATHTSNTPGALVESGAVPGKEYAIYANVKIVRSGNRIAVYGINLTSCTLTKTSGTGVVTSTGIDFSDHTAIGYANVRDKLVLFSTDKDNTSETPSGTYGAIWKIEFGSTNSVVDLNIDNTLNIVKHLIYVGELDFSVSNEIKAVSFRVKDDVAKVYWTDNYNTLRHINVYDYTSAAVTDSNLSLLSTVEMTKPSPIEVLNGGSYKSGVVYYAYQLYNKNGSESIISPISNGINLSEYSSGLSNTSKFSGSPIDQNTGKAVKFRIPDVDETFDRIIVYSIFYDQEEGSPIIRLLADKRIRNGGLFEMIDDGYSYVGTLSLQEFRNYNRFIFSCRDIAIKDNRLVCANILEDQFDVDYDARAYRHSALGLFSCDGNVAVATAENYNAIDEYADCVPGDIDVFKYKSDGATIGGTGVNVSYEFDNVLLPLDNNANSVVRCSAGRVFQEWSSVIDNEFIDNESYSNYASPINSSQLVGYKRGETYRFGAIFRDSKSRISPVKWIADITMPEQDDDLGNSNDNTSGENFARLLLDHLDVTYVEEFDAGTNVTIFNSYTVNETADYTHTFTLTVNGITASMVIGGGGCDVTVEQYLNALIDAVGVFDGAVSVDTKRSQLPLANEFLIYISINSTAAITITQKDIVSSKPATSWTFSVLNSGSTGTEASVGLNPIIVNTAVSPSTIVTPAANVMYPKFTLGNIPVDDEGNYCSYEIVRMRRNERDMTRMAQGLVLGTINATIVTGNEYYPIVDIITTSSNRKVRSFTNNGTATYINSKTLLNIINPLTNFRNFNAKAGDAVRMVSTMTTDQLQYESISHSKTENTDSGITYALKIKSVTPVATGASPTEQTVGYSSIVNAYEELSQNLPVSTVKDYEITPILMDGDKKIAKLGTSLFVGINTAFSGLTAANLYICEIVRDVADQYGGNTYYARQNSEYISCGHFSSGHASTKVNHVFGGDIYIAYFDYLRGMWVDKDYMQDVFKKKYADGNFQQVLYIPVESEINLEYRYDKCFSKVINDNEVESKFLQEKAGDYSGRAGGDLNYTQDYDLYLENRVYSKPNNAMVFLPKLEEESDTYRKDSQIIVSEELNYGALTDNMLRFLPSNAKIINSQYGPISGLITHRDNLFVFQSKAIGVQYINERSLMQDNTGSALVLGTGDVLGQFSYMTTSSGCQHRSSIVSADSGLYYFDSISRTFNVITGEGEKEVSAVKGMSSYFDRIISHEIVSRDNPINSRGIHAVYDEYNKRILLTYKNNALGLTLSYSELLQTFESLYSYRPNIYIKTFEDRILSTDPNTGKDSDMYLHNVGDYSKYYGTTYDSWVNFVVNDNPDINKIFTNVEFNSRVSKTTPWSSTDTYYDETISEIQLYNDYQDSGELSFVDDGTGDVLPGSSLELKRRHRKWRFAIPRHNDPESTRNSKFASTYLFQKMTYDNNDNKKFMLYDVLTYYYPAIY